mmetsp:Transcript_9167/g.20425  ORF Transcript_9167/g.20425 Transcript_9167/m.20425 type:complete len:319 (-) Transcript_9167:85-1041(-)
MQYSPIVQLLEILSFVGLSYCELRPPSLLSISTSLHKSPHAREAKILDRGWDARLENVSRLLCPYAEAGMLNTFLDLPQTTTKYWTGPAIHPLLSEAVGGPKQIAQTCAVVSNSGVLLNHMHGDEIDSADLVFRFNDAPAGGKYKEHVGERDDVHFINAEIMKDISRYEDEEPTSTLYVFQRPSTEQEWKRLESDQQTHPQMHMMMGSLEVMHWSKVLLGGVYPPADQWDKPTTGFYGLLVTMAMCDEVRAYGFPETPGSEVASYHYYGDLRTGSASENPHHPGAPTEKAFWKRIALNEDVDETDVAVFPGWHALRCT